MGSKASITLLLCFNLVFFTLVSSSYVPCPPPPSKSHHGHHHHGGVGHGGSPSTPTPIGGGSPATPTTPIGGGSPGTPTTPTVPSRGNCPIDALKLGVCANVLGNLLNIVLGTPPKTPCCPLINGLLDLEAAVCLCTAIRANILGINLNIPLSLSLLLNYCGKNVPSGFQCP